MVDLYGRDTAPWEEEKPEVDPDDFSQTDLDLAEAWLDRMRGGSLNNDREME